MKSILMSIQPKWCEMIVEHSHYRDDAFGGVKKLEVCKTKPKVKLPIDVYIYCCEPHKKTYRQTGQFDENGKQIYKTLPSGKTGYYIYNGGHAYPPYNRPCSNGKVFAKFTLNEVVDIDYRTIKSDYDYVPLTGLYKIDIVKYAKGKPLYGWKIDNLTIFDKPKELSDFYSIKQYYECINKYHKPIERPPQSWQYIQKLEEHMKVLVACEESQAVTIEFRKLGHEAYSCDIEPCSGGHPEWHIQDDVLPLLNGDCVFKTCNNSIHNIKSEWDMIIAFPPCTYLCISGNRWFNIKKYGNSAIKRFEEQKKAIEFFMRFVKAKCKKIVIENPVGKMSTYYRKPNQIINPYEFGHPEQKKTCLWLKGLPLLKPTNNVYEYMMTLPLKLRTRIHWLGSGKSKERSKTYQGIAKAMAEQWGQGQSQYADLPIMEGV